MISITTHSGYQQPTMTKKRICMAKVGTSNVNVQEIGSILNAAGGSVNINQPLTFFTEAAKINKWARYKPQHSSNPTKLSDHEREYGNYGLNVNWAYDSFVPKSIIVDMANGRDFYPYVLPTGGANSPYRLADFLGYDTNATLPYNIECPENLSVTRFPTYITFAATKNSSDSNVDLSKIANFYSYFTDGYFAVLWAKDISSSNSECYMARIVESDATIEDWHVSVGVNGEGTYYLVGVFAKVEVGYGTAIDVSSLAESFVPIPGSYREVKVTKNMQASSGKVVVSHLYDYDPPRYRNGQIYGFSSYPNFTVTPLEGSMPSCVYRFGFWVEVDMEGSTYHREWYYDYEYINVPALNRNSYTERWNMFPSSINMSEIFGDFWDPSIHPQAVERIVIRYDYQWVSGDGRLTTDSLDDMIKEVLIE